MFRSTLLIFGGLLATSPAMAQDRAAETKKQLTLALENFKQAELMAVKPIETADLIVLATAPEAKAKAMADLAQKSFELATKTLQFETKDKLWPGKLTVYVLLNREDYTKFSRRVLQERPDLKETVRSTLRSNEPFVLMTVPVSGKPTDAELQGELAAAVATAVLKQKAGTEANMFQLPDWLTTGFGKAIVNRVEGQSARQTAFKTKLRLLFAKGPKNPNPPKVNELWRGAERPKDFDLLATSLAEYFAFGPESKRFGKLLMGYKPSEEAPNPNTDAALDLLELKWDELDTAWKTWIIRGK